MADVMLDLETLGVGQDAVVLTFGAVKYDPYSKAEPFDPLYFRIDADAQAALGRKIDDSTLEWWSNQPKEIFEEAMSPYDRISLEETTKAISKYMVGANKIWAQGITFDIMLIESLYRMLNKPAPWSYHQIRDSRTVGDMGDFSAKTANKSQHNALADAYSQALGVQNVYSQLGVKRK